MTILRALGVLLVQGLTLPASAKEPVGPPTGLEEVMAQYLRDRETLDTLDPVVPDRCQEFGVAYSLQDVQSLFDKTKVNALSTWDDPVAAQLLPEAFPNLDAATAPVSSCYSMPDDSIVTAAMVLEAEATMTSHFLKWTRYRSLEVRSKPKRAKAKVLFQADDSVADDNQTNCTFDHLFAGHYRLVVERAGHKPASLDHVDLWNRSAILATCELVPDDSPEESSCRKD